MAVSRQSSLLFRRFLFGQRGFTSAAPSEAKAITRFSQLDAKIEKALPAKWQPIWNHPAGLKTIHFWAPMFKWCLVIAGLADYARPAEKLSVSQSGALAATGVIWSRYSMVVIPKNWNLFSVNIFLAMTGIMQLARIYRHHQKEKERVGDHPCPRINKK
ncbi:mitochondrial pyruvate carrier 4-like [Asterias rubens]|uniref:mitochondrial pyruvate carrier 4-like n=1 Tax=Asterias rubens TaxID=7604 RepID=UPI0014558769|nr:mitochondrial pyruvate carrier 4-like [Asterias rubens]XP_033635604.1 mitochondrial pyruvate carrier 4-like [Asterias rubens]